MSKMCIRPRGKWLVIEPIDDVQVTGGIAYPSNTKDERKVYPYKVIATGPDPDCKDIVKGSKILCRKDDVQVLCYKGQEGYLIDECFTYGSLID